MDTQKSEDTENTEGAGPARVRTSEAAIAWAVHAFTATGIVAGLLSIIAVMERDFRMGLVWLGVAMIIDGIDGPLARRFDVKQRTPRFDGSILDHVIDYMTYVAIPALMIHRFELAGTALSLPAAAVVMMVGLYTFGNRDMKTADNYFRGFPATWNLAVLYFFVLDTGAVLNLAVIALLCVLTFVPWSYVHPFRVRRLRPLTGLATLGWAAASLWLVLSAGAGGDQAPADAAPPVVFWIFVGTSLYFLVMSAWRSVRGPESAA